MLQIRNDDLVTITGIRGQGKSYLLKKIIAQTDSYIVYDAVHEHGSKDHVVCSDLNSLSFHLNKGHKKLIYRPKFISIDEFDWICAAVYNSGNRHLYVEEANRVMPNNKITLHASELIDLGRHRNVGMTVITRRIALLDKLPVSQSSHMMIFRTILPNDIKYLEEFIGPIAQDAKQLTNYRFIYYNDKEVVIHEAI